ncbi:hypothetical protein FKO59_17155 [Burkholderia pseudomallei]|nr:hypothetical protein FKO42_17185 [Burkholderia pseudomallei]QDH39375.1 hypothetical protein FKO59_17155 [Burkholderia pseudomallei]
MTRGARRPTRPARPARAKRRVPPARRPPRPHRIARRGMRRAESRAPPLQGPVLFGSTPRRLSRCGPIRSGLGTTRPPRLFAPRRASTPHHLIPSTHSQPRPLNASALPCSAWYGMHRGPRSRPNGRRFRAASRRSPARAASCHKRGPRRVL